MNTIFHLWKKKVAIQSPVFKSAPNNREVLYQIITTVIYFYGVYKLFMELFKT